MPESSRVVQDRSHLDKAIKAAENKVLGWAATFSIVQYIGPEAGQSSVNPLYQLYESGSKVSYISYKAV